MCPTILKNFLSTELYFQLVTEPTTKPTRTKSSTMPSTSTASTGSGGTGNTIQSHIFNFIFLVKQPNLSRYLSFIFGQNVTAKNNFSWSSGVLTFSTKKFHRFLFGRYIKPICKLVFISFKFKTCLAVSQIKSIKEFGSEKETYSVDQSRFSSR